MRAPRSHSKPTIRAFRSSLFHLKDDPFRSDRAVEAIEDAIVVVKDGKIEAVGPAAKLARKLPRGVKPVVFENAILVPGFIDAHVHYPQLEMIASYGEELLDWLERYSFPEEAKFRSLDHARAVASRFLDELLRHGTTTALVFGTSHPSSVEACFEEAERRRMRLIAGKVLMDRGAPAKLLDTAERGYRESRDLIKRWHGQGRLSYAVTPRFAITSTPEQLEAAGKLLREYPGVYLHTHLAENRREIERVHELFPDCANYLDVYDRFGLVGTRSVFAHCLHLADSEIDRLARAGSSVAFCPTSNLFLGSGLFPLQRYVHRESPVKIALGSDIGAGTSLSLLETMNEAYKVSRLQGERLSAAKAFYLATLGAARALSLDDHIGNFEPGKEADFVVLDTRPTSLVAQRMVRARKVEEKLFVLATLGDDRAIRATYVLGEKARLAR